MEKMNKKKVKDSEGGSDEIQGDRCPGKITILQNKKVILEITPAKCGSDSIPLHKVGCPTTKWKNNPLRTTVEEGMGITFLQRMMKRIPRTGGVVSENSGWRIERVKGRSQHLPGGRGSRRVIRTSFKKYIGGNDRFNRGGVLVKEDDEEGPILKRNSSGGGQAGAAVLPREIQFLGNPPGKGPRPKTWRKIGSRGGDAEKRRWDGGVSRKARCRATFNPR